MAQVYFLLFAGLALLFVSGKYLVDSSVAISRRLRIPRMIIGLTVVAFGTSAPELLVSLQAAFSGYPEIAMGNVVGSNISNILLVLAITALIFPIPVPPASVRRDWPIMMGITLLLFVFSRNGWISRLEGGIFVLLLAGYILFSVLQSRRVAQVEEDDTVKEPMPWRLALIILVLSCDALQDGNTARLEQEYLDKLFKIGVPVNFEFKDGSFEGIIRGIDDFGELLVERDGEIRAYGHGNIGMKLQFDRS